MNDLAHVWLVLLAYHFLLLLLFSSLSLSFSLFLSLSLLPPHLAGHGCIVFLTCGWDILVFRPSVNVRPALAMDMGRAQCNVIVLSCGSSCFGATCFTLDDGIFEVIGQAGDTHLGGVDFDMLLVDYSVSEYRRQNKKRVDIPLNDRAMRRLSAACERAKCVLSDEQATTIRVANFVDGVDFEIDITRAQFEDLADAYFRRTSAIVEKMLRDSRLAKADIRDVFLVGDSMHIPKLQATLRDFFEGRPPRMLFTPRATNPCEAAVVGAAADAVFTAGGWEAAFSNMCRIDALSFSLGLETAGGVMTVMCERNARVPLKREVMFTTNTDDQTAVAIQVFEGDGAYTADCVMLGRLDLTGIPPAPRGTTVFCISIDVNTCQKVIVTVDERPSGRRLVSTLAPPAPPHTRDPRLAIRRQDQ
jgi:heat shock protein 1/8